MSLLEPNEILMNVPQLVIAEKNHPPKTHREVLEGMERLWMRLVWLLKDDQETLDDLERAMNLSLKEQGAWETVSFKDQSYLNLLDPLVVEQGYGTSPQAMLEEIPWEVTDSEIILTADDPRNQDPSLPYELTEVFDTATVL